jgi:N-methylhydantoinase A
LPEAALGGYRIGVDIGGTFTDVLVASQHRPAATYKVLTTPADPSRGVAQALARVLEAGLVRPGDDGILVHGTTLVTNAIVERKGAPTALFASAGFRDVLEIGREHRYDHYDLMLERPKPLVPRHLSFGIPERIAKSSFVLEPLDETLVSRLARELSEKGIRAVAVSFLHSYRNAAHERRAAEIIHDVAPAMRVGLSSEIAPTLREFPRTSTTVANAYVQDLTERYLRELERSLRYLGLAGSVFVMFSTGGIATVDTAVRFPIRLLESGPAAGALAAADIAGRAGHANVISFDMGGTTAKLCAIRDGRPPKVHECEVDRIYRFKSGSGLPIATPIVDLIEIGAGGGSIARVDTLGLLKVGPESSGAEPGPACYGLGGTKPTVTDADLVLGYLNPGYFLGGEMTLDVDAARQALGILSVRMGLSVEEIAWGIHRIVNENMANAARVHLAERGMDPRRLPLFAFGGAGPVHCYGLAELLGTPTIISPLGAGVGSTHGLLVAPLAMDFVRSGYARLDAVDWQQARQLIEEMESEGRSILRHAGLAAEGITSERTVEMRYSGQGYEIAVPFNSLEGDPAPTLATAFVIAYRARYGRAGPNVPLEVLNWHVVVRGSQPSFDVRLRPEPISGEGARKGSRPAFFANTGFVNTPVWDRHALRPGTELVGPAIVEASQSTLVVGPRGRLTIDSDFNALVALR